MSKGRARLKSIVDDLTTLQINTIRQADLTGDGMSDPRHGLHDIADKYNSALNRHLAGDTRRLVGEGTTGRSVITVKWVAAAHRPGEAAMLAVHVTSHRGAPRAGIEVEALFRPAPKVVPIDAGGDDEGALRAQLVDREPVPALRRPAPDEPLEAIPRSVTDAEGGAFIGFNLPADAEPGCCVHLQTQGIKVDVEVPLTKVRGNLTTLHYLNRRANEAPDRDHWLVRRIELNSVRLMGMLQTLPGVGEADYDANDYGRSALNGPNQPPPMKLSPPDLVLIRKVWELGCEQIVMQTIVQLDGDVVTRLSGGLEGEHHRIIHQVHADGVRVATESWRYLVETVAGLTRSFLGWFAR